MPKTKFWVVYSKEGKRSNNERYSSKALAITTAEKMVKNDGGSYYILEATDIVVLPIGDVTVEPIV